MIRSNGTFARMAEGDLFQGKRGYAIETSEKRRILWEPILSGSLVAPHICGSSEVQVYSRICTIEYD